MSAARLEPPKLKPVSGFKPVRIPPGFRLVIDTREQCPLFSDPRPDLPIVRRCLPIGDYSVDGYERQIAFELKRLTDLLSFIGVEHNTRTVGKLERMAACRFAALVIQEDEKTLAGTFKYSKLTREHIRGFLLSCRVKYSIHTYVNKNAEALERWILDSAIKTWKELQ